VGKQEVKRKPLRSKRGWKGNIKIHLKGIGWTHRLDWSAPFKDKWRATVRRSKETSCSIECREFFDLLKN